MAQPRLQQPLHLGLAEGFAAAARPEIDLHRQPGSPGVAQGDLRGNVVAAAQQRFHPGSQLHLPFFSPTGKNVRQKGAHLPLAGQGVPLGRPLAG